MKAQYRVFHGQNFLHADVHGHVNFDASMKAFDKLAGNPAIPGNQRILVDLRSSECRMSITDVYLFVEDGEDVGEFSVPWRASKEDIVLRCDRVVKVHLTDAHPGEVFTRNLGRQA